MKRMRVPPAVEGSWDHLLHKQNNGSNSLLIFRGENNQGNKSEEFIAPDSEVGITTNNIKRKKGQRAIGVVYNPEYERYSALIFFLPFRYSI
jgi:erythromycin esterase